MAFKNDLLALLDECEHEKIYGKMYHVCMNSYLQIRISIHIWFNIYQLVKLYSLLIGDWVFKLFMHQACVFINQKQYNKSNELLPCIIKEAHHQGILSDSLKEALGAFQVKLNNKQLYLANWVRRAIPNSYDAMTTSLVESINSHIKKRICASSLNKCQLFFDDDHRWYVQSCLYKSICHDIIVSVCIY